VRAASARHACPRARRGASPWNFAFPPPARQKLTMPERPGDPPPRARVFTDRERAEAAKMREIAKKAPPLPAATPPFPREPPWSAGLAELAHLWLSIRCECRAGGALPLRYLAAAHGWKTPLSDVVGRLKCTNCRERRHRSSLSTTRLQMQRECQNRERSIGCG
jgi:hypothetical protein